MSTLLENNIWEKSQPLIERSSIIRLYVVSESSDSGVERRRQQGEVSVSVKSFKD